MKKIIIAISALLCAASALYGQEFNYDRIEHNVVKVDQGANELARQKVRDNIENLRFVITAGGLNAMMEPSSIYQKFITFMPKTDDPDFIGNCISVSQAKSNQEGIVKEIRGILSGPEYLPYFELMVNMYGSKPERCSFYFCEKFNPRSKKDKVWYYMDIPFSTLFPDWDEKYNAGVVFGDGLKRCSDARPSGLGVGEYLGYDNGMISLRYDYGNADFASMDEARMGILLQLMERLYKYNGDIWDSLEHMAMSTGQDINMILRNKDTGTSESLIFTSAQFVSLKTGYSAGVPMDSHRHKVTALLNEVNRYTASRDRLLKEKKVKAADVEIAIKLKPIMEKYKAEYNSCKAEMSVPAPLKTVTVLRTADNVVKWYDLLDRNVISRADVLKLIVANTEQGHNYVNYLLCGWANGDMSKSFFFNLVPNKGTLVSPVSYSFSPQDIYEALKDKYGD